MIKQGTSRQLQALLRELEERRDLQLDCALDRETATLEELEYMAECDDHQTRETWNVSRSLAWLTVVRSDVDHERYHRHDGAAGQRV